MHSLVQAVLGLLLFGVVIWFARTTYRNPDPNNPPWNGGYILPPFRWTAARLKSFAVFWIFASVLLITANLSRLTFPLWRPPIILYLAVCAVITFVLIPRRTKSSEK
nr:hypothetical protein [uncultured Paludibaculum sp.]